MSGDSDTALAEAINELYKACNGFMYLNIYLGGNARHGEMFDEQTETYVLPPPSKFRQQAT